jgi:integrase
VSVRRRGNRWEVRYRDGDRHRSRTFLTEDDAQEFDRRKRRARVMGAFADVEPSTMRLGELLKRWWDDESDGWARSNRVPRANIMDNWIAPYLGTVPLREIGRERLNEYRAEIIRSGCTAKQANRSLRTISAALGYAVRTDRLPENPCLRLRRQKVVEAGPRPRAIAVTKIEELREAMPTPRDQAMVSLLFYAGLRPGEMLALRWSDVHECTITVDRNYTAGELKGTKTGKRRSVMLIPALRDELAELRPHDAHEDDLIASDTNGRFIHLGNWRNRVWNGAVAAVGLDAAPERGIARLTPYDGRHSFASALIHEGRSILEVAIQLGHGSAQTTLNHYAHLVEEARDQDRIPLANAVAQARDVPDVRTLYAQRPRRGLRLVS